MEKVNDIQHWPDLVVALRAWKHSREDVVPLWRLELRVVHPAVLPELRVEPRHLPVDYYRDR